MGVEDCSLIFLVSCTVCALYDKEKSYYIHNTCTVFSVVNRICSIILKTNGFISNHDIYATDSRFGGRMTISWSYAVLYKPSTAGPQKALQDGTLTYYPASQKAELFNEEGESIDCLQPATATMLFEGGQFHLENYFVQIDSDKTNVDDHPKHKTKTATDNSKPLVIKPSVTVEESFHECMCTRDKNKKGKIWIDGWMHILAGYSNLVKFYIIEESDESSKLIHAKKVKSYEEVKGGTILSTSSFLIEIMEKISDPIKIKKLKESLSIKKESIPDENVKISKAEKTAVAARYSILYTTDKIRKHKRWKDGFLQYSPSKPSTFYDEEGKVLMRRSVGSNDLQEGTEIVTGMYIFQMGELLSVSSTHTKVADENLVSDKSQNVVNVHNGVHRKVQIPQKRSVPSEVKSAGRSSMVILIASIYNNIFRF